MPPLFFQWNFGVWNLSVRPSEAADSLSALRALDLAIDLNLGLLPHAPVTLALGLGVALVALLRRRPQPALEVLLLLPLLAIACTANSNWNNDTAGPSRYVVWMFPLLAFAAAGGGGAPERPPGRAAAWALALALATQAVPLAARGGPLAPSDFLRHSMAARYVLDRWPRLYRPAPEVFVERTLGHEGPYEGPVVYLDAVGRCRKASLQPRHTEKLTALCGAPPARRARAAPRAPSRTGHEARLALRGVLAGPGPGEKRDLPRPKLAPLARAPGRRARGRRSPRARARRTSWPTAAHMRRTWRFLPSVSTISSQARPRGRAARAPSTRTSAGRVSVPSLERHALAQGGERLRRRARRGRARGSASGRAPRGR